MASSEVVRHNRTVLASLKEGDLIEFPRGVYSHWAVYIGNEDVIHLAGDDNDGINAEMHSAHLTSFSGQCFEKAVIRQDNFFDVAGLSKAKRNNDRDGKKQPLPRSQIVKNAKSRLDEVGFNVLNRNCQHFATWCRYGVASSDQVDFLLVATVLSVGVVAGAFIIAVAKGCNKWKYPR
ncbi:hypothetical protein C0Q70_17365 [Pomacea canaliculata]|uniref:LRAT domain-containing protein n=1 Tax=Pomacea canaliculata TaxID=400727 RepID=A0A2T7NK72_POMCA|nr:HRAS-like suppressor 3 [Pomacea canaliculata]PVD21567.1 hypothetical protein C0Q70_17365 [Pomacea canaliculata]